MSRGRRIKSRKAFLECLGVPTTELNDPAEMQQIHEIPVLSRSQIEERVGPPAETILEGNLIVFVYRVSEGQTAVCGQAGLIEGETLMNFGVAGSLDAVLRHLQVLRDRART